MRIRRVLFGWISKPGEYCLSRVPPDIPQGRPERFANMAEAEEVAALRRATLIWSGPAFVEKQRNEARLKAEDDRWSPSR